MLFNILNTSIICISILISTVIKTARKRNHPDKNKIALRFSIAEKFRTILYHSACCRILADESRMKQKVGHGDSIHYIQ